MTSDSGWNVADWLTSFGMKECLPKFLEHGYETEKLCSNLLAEDLEAMRIRDKMHLEVIFTQSEILKKKLQERVAVPNGQPPTFVPGAYSTPFDETDGASPKLQVKKHKVKKSPLMQGKLRIAAAAEKHPVPPPESQRSYAGLTKLQLKLKIKEEIRKNHIVLSEAPYCMEDGSANEELLQELAEEYAVRFSLESLTVYYALKDVWRFTANEKSELATPMAGELKKVRNVSDALPELSNYSEPFDNKAPSPVKSAGKATKKVCASGNASPKTPPASFHTMPGVTGTYADPFDAIPQVSKSSPPSAELKRRIPLPSPKLVNSSPRKSHDDSNIKRRVSPRLLKKHSFTLPASPSLSSTSSEESPKKSPRSHRIWSPFKKRTSAGNTLPRSPQHLSQREPQVVHGSMENLQQLQVIARANNGQNSPQKRFSRQSLPGGLPGLSRSITTEPGLLRDSASDKSPISVKKLGGSREGLVDGGSDSPITRPSSSSGGSLNEERVVSRVKALTVKRSNSDFELSNIVELYVEGKDTPFRFKKAQSTEELDKEENSRVDSLEKKKKSSNILSRLFKPKSKKDKQKASGKKTKSQSVSDDLITPSKTMPNSARTAAAVIHSEYTEVFDDDVRGKTKTPSPSPSPRIPQRKRPHSTKPQRTTCSQSPKTSPPIHHRLMVKSDSIGSSEVTIHNIPANEEDDDSIIELSIPGTATVAGSSVCDSQVEVEKKEHCRNLSQGQEREGIESRTDEIILDDSVSVENDQGVERPNSIARTHSGSQEREGIERSPEQDSSLPKTDDTVFDESVCAKDDQGVERPSSMGRTHSGSKPPMALKPPLAPKPAISRERITSGSSQKRISGCSVESEPTSPSPSHSLSPMEGHSSESKPPPKPSRSKAKIVKHPSPTSTEVKSGEEGPTLKLGQIPVSSEVEITLEACKDVRNVMEQSSEQPCASARPPKPPKPTCLLRSVSPQAQLKVENSSALLDALERKLTEENIDLSEEPYTNQLGEYNIPSALVSRYTDEMHSPAKDIALSLEEIRRRSLSRLSRKYTPFVGNWKNHSSLDVTTVKSFLTSVGLPMYYTAFMDCGYSSVELIRSAPTEQIYRLPLSDRHRQLLSKAVLSL